MTFACASCGREGKTPRYVDLRYVGDLCRDCFGVLVRLCVG